MMASFIGHVTDPPVVINPLTSQFPSDVNSKRSLNNDIAPYPSQSFHTHSNGLANFVNIDVMIDDSVDLVISYGNSNVTTMPSSDVMVNMIMSVFFLTSAFIGMFGF
jgi:hypothetical protein